MDNVDWDSQMKRARDADNMYTKALNESVENVRKLMDAPQYVQAIAAAPLLVVLPGMTVEFLIKIATLREMAHGFKDEELRRVCQLTLDAVQGMVKGESFEEIASRIRQEERGF